MIQNPSDTCYPPVHHIRRSNHICARLYLGQGRLCQKFQRPVIVHLLTAEHAAMSMGGILAHAYISNQIQIRADLFRLAKCFLHNPVLRVGAAAQLILPVRNPKQHHGTHPGVAKLHQLFLHTIHTVTVLPRHGVNFLLAVISLLHKHWIYKGRFIHARFARHFPQNLIAAQSARSLYQLHFYLPPNHNNQRPQPIIPFIPTGRRPPRCQSLHALPSRSSSPVPVPPPPSALRCRLPKPVRNPFPPLPWQTPEQLTRL